MALLNEHIQHIRQTLSSGPVSDDFSISDRYIYFILKYVRTTLIKQKLNKGYKLNPLNYQTIHCLDLELADKAECPCEITGCTILRSKCKLPRIISHRSNLAIDGVFTIDFNKRFSMTTRNKLLYNRYSKTKHDKEQFFIADDYLYVISPNKQLAKITVAALFEDPLEVSKIECTCSDSDSPSTCYDPFTEDFPLDADLTKTLHEMTYKDLFNYRLRIPNDIENNAQDIQIGQQKDS